MGEELAELPTMKQIAALRLRLEESRTEYPEGWALGLEDLDFLLGLIDFLVYPENHGWAVSRTYLRESAVLLGAYHGKTAWDH